MAASGIGQVGTADFQNNVLSKFLVFNYGTFTANPATPGPLGPQDGASGSTGTLDIGLYWSLTPFTNPSQGTLAGIETIGPFLGIIGAGNNNVFPVAGTTPTEQVYVQVFAWDSTFATPQAALANGADFGASSAGMVNPLSGYGTIGASTLITLGYPGAGPPSTPFFTPDGPFGPTLVLLNTPEPATVVLGGLGATALLLFRRRRSRI